MTKQLSNHWLAMIAGALLAFPLLWQLIDPVFERPAGKGLELEHQPVDFIRPVAGIKLELFLRCSGEME